MSEAAWHNNERKMAERPAARGAWQRKRGHSPSTAERGKGI